MKASPEQYVQASDDYVILCDSGVEIELQGLVLCMKNNFMYR